jgi:hypothetical protein
MVFTGLQKVHDLYIIYSADIDFVKLLTFKGEGWKVILTLSLHSGGIGSLIPLFGNFTEYILNFRW